MTFMPFGRVVVRMSRSAIDAAIPGEETGDADECFSEDNNFMDLIRFYHFSLARFRPV
jgi:hypothetical protein